MFMLKLLLRVTLYMLLISMISSACTTINVMHERLSDLMYIDSSMVKYVESFKREGALRGKIVDDSKLTMIFGTTKDSSSSETVGFCTAMSARPLIIIDKESWDVSSDLDREQLAFHELGHCLLSRDHCEVEVNHRVVTIMGPNMLPEITYKTRRKSFVDELFKANANCHFLDMNRFLF